MNSKAQTTIQLLNDGPNAGDWNMAVDQALLELANREGLGTLRFYRWAPATLSLGYFQSYQSREQHAASQSCDIVRRASGGGAIVHHHELTYSLSIPSEHRWSSKNRDLYELVHQIIIRQLADCGMKAEIYRQELMGQSVGTKRQQPFLCFQRRAEGDIVMDGWKIVGSAQRRLDRALIQHGSILLRKSPFAPELPGIAELVGVGELELLEAGIRERLVEELANRLGVSFQIAELGQKEHREARKLQNDRFGNENWAKRR